MYGGPIGDIIGSPYEFDRGDKTKDFPLFSEESKFTDDTVMTVAVADALLGLVEGKNEAETKCEGGNRSEAEAKSATKTPTDEEIHSAVIRSMREWGRKYPWAGYGRRFFDWLADEEMGPYGSCGNGSAMRVSAAGWLCDDLDETRRVARATAVVTHDHPEGVKGAEATAAAIFLARTGKSKEYIKEYIVNEFDYDLSRTCDEIRPGFRHIEICQKTVPEALTAFFEGDGFEDVVRTAVSLGGDCDTVTCIAASIAEAFYGAPEAITEECIRRIPEEMNEVLKRIDCI